MRKTILYLNLLFPLILCAGERSSKVKEMNESVILVHGLIRTKVSMMILGGYLKKKGYDVVYYSYYSTRQNLGCHSAKFADFIATFAKKNPETKINIVSHSMGGIITRSALADLEGRRSNNECRTLRQSSGQVPQRGKNKFNFGRIVMIAPPNQGSMAATVFGSGWLISKLIKPLPELRNSQNSPIHSVPLIDDVEVGIISGKYDVKVRPEEAKLEGEKEHLVVNSSHTFMMNRKHVKNAVFNFLKNGSFKK